jgi:hypothetical protein
MLSPAEQPEYPVNVSTYGIHGASPENPGAVPIQGCLSVADLRRRVIHTHAGHWGDPWTAVTLPNYLPQRAARARFAYKCC